MSKAITLQPNRLSTRYSAGKQSQEDLLESDNQEPNIGKNTENHENPTAEPGHDSATVYVEETFCDYMINICQCTSWLCANLVSSIVLCFEGCADFVHTCKCNNYCCDVCGGSENSLEDRHEMTDNIRNNDVCETTEDDYIICFSQDIEEVLSDSCVVVEKNKMPIVEENKMPIVEENKLPIVEENKLPIVEENKLPIVEENNLPIVEENKMPIVEENKMPIVEENKLPIVEENKLPIVEENKLPIVEENNLPIVEENKMPIVEENKKPIVEENKKPIVEESKILEENISNNQTQSDESENKKKSWI